jgi:16S rRNA (cytosine1402-N4)-methyltransferase
MKHTPVLLKQVIDALEIEKGKKYLDATFGQGGYSVEIVRRGGEVLAIDLDQEQINRFQKENKLSEQEKSRLKLVWGNFKDVETIAKSNHFFPVDGVVFDLGLSMGQISDSGRGFSYQKPEEILDMRLDLKNQVKAMDILNKESKDKLYLILAKYSEEIFSKKIVENIVFFRKKKKIETVSDLLTVIDKSLGRKDKKTYARVFQALRIAVNDEIENLKEGLVGALKILKPNGKIAIVSFHSIEDRVIKNFIRKNQLKVFGKKPIFGIESFERSAKLRVITYEKN